jgi:transcription antitermination factor NusG
VYPERTSCVWEREDSRESSLLPWFALGLRSNFEKTTAQLLENEGYEVFLPTYRVLRRWSDRDKQIQIPLFAGYMFCRMDINRRAPVQGTPGVVRIIGFGKNPVPVPQNEIEAVRAIVESRLFSQPWPFLSVGDRVVVERGPLAGTEGFLTRVNGEYRLVASITLLQRSIAVELEREWVRPVDRVLRHAPAMAQDCDGPSCKTIRASDA